MNTQPNLPITTVHLLPMLDEQLLSLLHSLSPEDWQKQTIASQWKVKDVVAHLLDGNIRTLSMLRDTWYSETPEIDTHAKLLDYLNGLNADWVKAMKRVSSAMLILLHEATGKTYCDYYASLDPFGKAGFAVNWAGEEESKNWMHIAREYTEKWLHQQQIRDAVGKPGLMVPAFFNPLIRTFMMALPHTFRTISVEENTYVQVTVTSDAGGTWQIRYRAGKWQFANEHVTNPAATLFIDPDTSWRLFSKSLRPKDVMDTIRLEGNSSLAEQALYMISVMA